MPRSFIIGSGFSRSMGLPTMLELFDAIFQMEGTIVPPADDFAREFSQVRTAFSFLYPNVDSSKDSHAYPPFEEFLSLAYVSSDFETRGKSELGIFSEGVWQDYYNAGVKLLSKAIERASVKIEFSKESSLSRFIDALKPDDTIITFNWDTLLEKQMEQDKVPFTLDPFADSDIHLLKLHGSLSWVHLDPSTQPMNKEYFSALCEDEHLLCSIDHSILDTWLPLGKSPYIVTPIAQKRPLDLNYMKRLWIHAFDCLAQSTVTAVIGYSMPNEDYHARALLRDGLYTAEHAGLQPRIVFINPDETSGARFYSKIWQVFEFQRRRFDGTEMIDPGEPQESGST